MYEILRREKSKDELQKLDESFFRDVLDYLKEKASIVQEAAGKFDMFSVEEKESTQNQLNNVRRILKEIYEKREKKIIEMALNKSKTNSNIIDTTNLLAKEHELYNETVSTLDSFRKNILLTLLEMKPPEITHQSPPEPKPEPVPEPPTPEPQPPVPKPIPEPPAPEPVPPEPEPASDKLKVKFLQKVEQFVGKELELYGPFEPETTAELPKEIADILVNKGSASVV